MSKYGNSYNGKDFLEWWKHHYGTDYDGSSNIVQTENMTDEDVAIGKTLLNSYNTKNQLTNTYNQNVDTENKKYQDLIDSTKNAYNSQIEKAQSEYERNAQLLLDNYNRNSDSAKNLYEQNINELLENYNTSQSALDKSKRQSQQSASITLDKLKKYLPTQIKAQGLGGLGVSESSLLQAYNNYTQNMGDIENNYQDNKTNLETNYNTNKRNYDTNFQEAKTKLENLYAENKNSLQGSLDKAKSDYELAKSQAEDTYKAQLAETLAKLKNNYDTDYYNADKDANGNYLVDNTIEKYAQMLKEDRENAYIVAQATVEDLIANENYEEAQKYLDENKDILGEEVYKSYVSKLTPKVAQKQEETRKVEQEETDKRIIEGKEYINYNGSNYKIKSQLNQNSNEIKKNRDFTNQLKEKFGTENPYDSKIPNGTTLAIKCDSSGSNEFNFVKDVMGFDYSNWKSWLIPGYNIYNQINNAANLETRYVTYYNGEWYLSDKK